jgi:hypothetical protein
MAYYDADGYVGVLKGTGYIPQILGQSVYGKSCSWTVTKTTSIVVGLVVSNVLVEMVGWMRGLGGEKCAEEYVPSWKGYLGTVRYMVIVRVWNDLSEVGIFREDNLFECGYLMQ